MRSILFIMCCVGFVNLLFGQTSNNPFQLVNSAFDEQNPVLTADGQTLYFTIANHPQNVGGLRDPGDIWFSKWIDNQWSAPIHAGSVLNNRGYNGIASISVSGKELYLLSHYDVGEGAAKTQGIAVSVDRGSGWTKPENITIPYFQNKSAMISGSMDITGSIFIYSAETYGTYGVEDLYVCTKERDGKWTAPKNLGASINTQFQEVGPSLSDDGKTLYFSSNGRKGQGSFDVYSSKRLDNSWTNWSAPVNQGTSINSEGRELGYRNYEQYGYSVYTSTINSDGYGDIRIFKTNDPLPPKPPTEKVDTVIAIVLVIHEPTENDSLVSVYGKVTNAKTSEPISAKLTFSGVTINQSIYASLSGYRIDVNSTDQFKIQVEAEGFISTLEELDINTIEMKTLEMNFKLEPVSVGAKVNLKSVLFEQGSTNLLTGSYQELDLVVTFLNANPSVRIELLGHTDNRGVHSHNVKLSQARVDRVKEYMVSKGISSRRIKGKGYGGTQPIADNSNEETRMLNRRVEFRITKY